MVSTHFRFNRISKLDNNHI